MLCRSLRFAGASLVWLAPILALSAAPRFADTPVPHDVHWAWPLPNPAANDVRALAIDPARGVWAATRDGIYRADPARAGWRRYGLPGELAPAFAIGVDANGTAWVGAWDGLHHLQGERWTRVAGVEGPISALAVAGETVLAGGPAGFVRVRAGRAEPWEPGCNRYLNRIAVASDGTVWFATRMGLFHEKGSNAHPVTPEFERVSVDIRDLAFAPSGVVYAAALGGLWEFHGQRLARQITPQEGLPSADVRCVERDPSGRLWVGTAQGVARRDPSGWAVRRGRRWLLNDEVRDLRLNPDGAAWIATANGVSLLTRTNLTLAAKAEGFQHVLEARHIRPPGIVEKCRLRRAGDLDTWEPSDDDNDGGYTALYLAMESYRYAASGATAALAGAQRAFRTLEFLQRVTGTDGFVARTVVPADWTQMHDPNETLSAPDWAEERVSDPRSKQVPERWRLSADGRWRWKGDTSSDEISAHMFGYFVYAELAASPSERERVRDQVMRIVDHLLAHGYNLTDLDGRPTRWGIWGPDSLNHDPNWAMERGINSVELLSFLRLAYHLSREPRYLAHYQALVAQHHYDRNVEEAPNLNPAWRTHIDAELLAFAYPVLLQTETNPRLQRIYRASFERWHRAVRDAHTPFFEFLYARYARATRRQLANALAFLRDTPLDLVRWDVDSRSREDIRLRRFPEVEFWQTDRRLPPSEIGYSRTDQNPWLAVQGDGGRTESDGVFWLLPYWMGRYHGFIAAPGE